VIILWKTTNVLWRRHRQVVVLEIVWQLSSFPPRIIYNKHINVNIYTNTIKHIKKKSVNSTVTIISFL